MLTKRAVLAAFPLALTLAMPRPSRTLAATPSQRVATGADALSASGFAELAGKRVGLITNQTGLVRNVHLADALHTAADVKLTAILAPEHGFRGSVEAGKRRIREARGIEFGAGTDEEAVRSGRFERAAGARQPVRGG